MPGRARTALLLLTIGFCCTGLSADAAKDAWKKCKKSDRNEPGIRLRECSLAIESGALSNEDGSEAHFIRASAYFETGDYDRALKDLDESVRLTPSASPVVNTRGWMYLAKFEYQRAIQDFNQAIQLDRNNSYAYANRAIAEFLLGNFGAAQDDFAQNERLSPKIARPYSELERLLAFMREGKEKAPGGPQV